MRPIAAFIRQLLIVIVGCTGLIWGTYVLPGSENVDSSLALEGPLLRSETFDPAGLKRTIENWNALNVSSCETHFQRVLLLLEMPLTEAALRSGTSQQFDQRVQSLEARSKQILRCTPRDSFVWFLLFGLNVLHGELDKRTFDLLETSYDYSPNEAWISIRRIGVALPLILLMSDSLRKIVLSEFDRLIRDGFVEEAARSYALSSEAVRMVLKTDIAQLAMGQQKAFSTALQKFQPKL